MRPGKGRPWRAWAVAQGPTAKLKPREVQDAGPLMPPTKAQATPLTPFRAGMAPGRADQIQSPSSLDAFLHPQDLLTDESHLPLPISELSPRYSSEWAFLTPECWLPAPA